MACELEEAFDRARSALPEGWVFDRFEQQPLGWSVFAKDSVRDNATGFHGRTLTKALDGLANLLETTNAQG